MLLSLHIRDFAIIDELELDLHGGMTALTGETGAGKSILLDALGLLLGDRADAGMVRHGAARAEVSAAFDTSASSGDEINAWLASHDLAMDGECQLRRVILAEGRSRAYINGSSVPVQALRQLGEHLVDIHGQHEHQSLMKSDHQRRLLDHHGGHLKLLEQLNSTVRDWQAAGKAMTDILGQDQDRDARLEFLRFQLQEFDELAPLEGEAGSLHEELSRLSGAGQLLDTLAQQIEQLYDDDASVYNRLAGALGEVQSAASIDTRLAEATTMLDSALVNLQEGVEVLRDYRDGFEQDPQRLAQVEQRLDELHRLARKHRIEPEALPAFHQRLQDELQQLESAGERLEQLEAQRQALASDYADLAKRLHKKRQSTARSMARQITAAMQDLGMQGGKLEIEIRSSDSAEPLSGAGARVEFMVSANPGQPVRPLAKTASGGELSRISLAIQVVAAQDTSIPCMIFDEVDSGVGGAVAETVGQQLQLLGGKCQVLCVTHLPQVAAQAHQHLQVSKLTGGNTTRTHIRRLGEEERVEEIARMLGGQKITASTLGHAREMLLAAQPAAGAVRTSD